MSLGRLPVAVMRIAFGASLLLALFSLPAFAAPAQSGGVNDALTTPPGASVRFAILESDTLILAISKNNGALCGVWERKTGRHLLTECRDQYVQVRRSTTANADEGEDFVTKLAFSQKQKALDVTCENSQMSDLTISKHYVVKPGSLFVKRVGFQTSDPKGYFIKYASGTALDPQFVAQSKPDGAYENRQVVANGKLMDLADVKFLEQYNTAPPPLMIAQDYSVGVASYRYSVNDRFVLTAPSRLRPTGWDNTVFSDHLKAGQEVSGETQWVVFRGDFTAFYRHYQSLPEYQKELAYTHPAWLNRVVCDAMYMAGTTDGFYKLAVPSLVTTTIWFLNSPWGNWGADHHDPNDRYPNVYGIAPSFRATLPNARVAKYNNFAFDEASDIFKQHPEYGIQDQTGHHLYNSGGISDSTHGPAYYFEIKNPVVHDKLISMFRSQLRDWNLDYLYLDGGGGSQEIIDWGYPQVAQGYDWLDLGRDIRQAIRADNPNAVVWINGEAPWADVSYIEYRDPSWLALMSPDWRANAKELFRWKLTEAPGHLTVPTYGNYAADPALSAYTYIYGWCGHIPRPERLPWMRAALECRSSVLVEDAVEPRWYRTGGSVEAYGFRRKGMGIVNVINHNGVPETVSVTVNPQKLGLPPGKPLYAWLLQMNETPREGSDPKDATKTVLIVPSTTAFTPSILKWGISSTRLLKLEIPTRPRLVSSVILSTTPAILESVDGKPTETGITQNLDVSVDGSRDTNGGASFHIDCRADAAGVFVPGCSLQNATVVSPVPVTETQWGGQTGLLLRVTRGIHDVRVIAKNSEARAEIFEDNFDEPQGTVWPDTASTGGATYQIKRVEGFDFNSVLQIIGGNAWSYSRMTKLVAPAAQDDRYLVCNFWVRILKADSGNTPPEVLFNVTDSRGAIQNAFQFPSQSAPAHPGEILCDGRSAGKYQVSAPDLEPVNNKSVWNDLEIILDQQTGLIRLFREGKQIDTWTASRAMKNWKSVQIMIDTPNGSGFGIAQFDSFHVFAAQDLISL